MPANQPISEILAIRLGHGEVVERQGKVLGIVVADQAQEALAAGVIEDQARRELRTLADGERLDRKARALPIGDLGVIEHLQTDDIVVHVIHGIARFRGLAPMRKGLLGIRN